jgi:SAM-dependent methyltransferase
VPRIVRDDADNPDPGFADLYASLPEPEHPEPWLTLAQAARGPVLYLGIGAGRLAAPLARAGVHIVGVDAHPAMLDEARKRLSRAELIQSRFIDLDLTGRRFELVLAPSSVGELPGCREAAARHLAPRGRAVFELTNRHWIAAGAGPGFRVVGRRGSAYEIEVDYQGGFMQVAEIDPPAPESSEEWLAEAGLRLVRLDGWTDRELETSPTFFVTAQTSRRSRPPGNR